ncbi:MAG: ABC transporter ATP-binding protein [Polyangiaceae bacterium]
MNVEPNLPLFRRPAAPRASAALHNRVILDAALDAIEKMGDLAGVPLARAEARRALERSPLGPASARDSKDPEAASITDAWVDAVVRGAGAVGLEVRVCPRSIAELTEGAAAAQLPLVGLGLGRADLAPIIVREAAANHVAVETPEKLSWMRAGRVAELFSVDDPSERIPFLMAEASAPLAMCKSTPEHPATPFRRLLSLIQLERDDVWTAVLYAIGVGVISLAAPIGVQALVSSVAFGGLLQPVLVLTTLVFVGLAAAALLRALSSWVVERIQQRVFARVAVDLAHRLPRISSQVLDKNHGPELVNRFFEVLGIQKGLAMLLADGLGVALATLVGMVLLAFYHPALLAFDVVLIAILGLLLFGMGGRAVETAIKESKRKYELAAWLEEMVRHPTTFKTAGGPAFAAARAEDLLKGYLAARAKHFKYLFRQTAGALALQASASAALLGVGGWLVIEGKLTLGQLVAAELIVALVVAGFAKLGKYLETYYDLLAGVDKLGQLIDLPLEPTNGHILEPSERGLALQLNGVAFGYPGQRDLFSDVQLDVMPGRRVAILGANGAGKSTLVDLLYGLRTPTRGRIQLDGVDTRDLHLESWREHVALVRGSEIFDGTVFENVRVGRPDIGLAEVRAALDAVGVLEDVDALPEGVHTELSTGAPELSFGQARSIAIARAIAGRPRLLILDESLDGLDELSERRVRETLFARTAPWSLLVTTHDKAALSAADEIYVFDGGSLRALRAEDLTRP